MVWIGVPANRSRALWRAAILVVALHFSGLSRAAEQLAPAFEMERLLLLAGQQVATRDFPGAENTLLALQALALDLPPEFHYYQGLVAEEQGRPAAARDALVRYVNQAGREGGFYQQALSRISALEARLPRDAPPPGNQPKGASPSADAAQVAARPAPEIEAVERQAYERRLMTLYLANEPAAALVEHINALLASKVYVASRVRDLTRRQGIQYQISLADGVVVVQETSYAEDGRAGITVERTPVFGVNPFLDSGCDFARDQCWVLHPVRGTERWLVIAADQTALRDLVQAFGYLIRHLQE